MSEIEEKKKKLLKALKAEKERLSELHGTFTENDQAIAYLETGILIEDYENDEALCEVVEDFDCICSDYADYK